MLLLAGIVAVLLGGGVAAAVILSEGEEEACVSEDTGEAEPCESADSISEEEFAQEVADEEAAQAEADECQSQIGGLLKQVQETDSRLSVGLVYAEYSRQIGNVRVAYDQVPFRQLGIECVSEVGKPLEDAMNSYTAAGDRWNDCISDFGCEQDSIDPLLQSDWLDASADLRKAESGLRVIARP